MTKWQRGPSHPLARQGRHHEVPKEMHQPWLWAWGAKVGSNRGQVGWRGGMEGLRGTQVPGRGSIAWGCGFRQPGLGPQPFDEGPGPLHPLQRDPGSTAAMVTIKHLCWGWAEVLSETDGEAWPLQPGQMCTSLLLPVRCAQGSGFLADPKGTWHRSLIPSFSRYCPLVGCISEHASPLSLWSVYS